MTEMRAQRRRQRGKFTEILQWSECPSSSFSGHQTVPERTGNPTSRAVRARKRAVLRGFRGVSTRTWVRDPLICLVSAPIWA